jgi:hypothetical protein
MKWAVLQIVNKSENWAVMETWVYQRRYVVSRRSKHPLSIDHIRREV